MHDFRDAYSWMRKQMLERLGPSPFSGAWPVWAWYKWEGDLRPKPGLRAAGHLPPKEKGVRLELEVEESDVLHSDFDLWHYVLNYWSLEDDRKFERLLEKKGISFYRSKPLPHPKYHQRIVKSWDRIFDLSWKARGLTSPPRKRPIQACLWFIDTSMVRSKKEFVAR